MPITFACPCGKQLKVGDEYAGKRARCPACASVLDVPAVPDFPAAPPAPAVDEDAAFKLLDDGPPAPTARRTDRDLADDFRRPDSLAPPVRRRDRDAPPRARYRDVEDTPDEPERRSSSGGGPHFPTVFGGLFSMALGGFLCWLRNGGVSIVGIVLLVLGFVSVVKGLLGYEDN